MTASSRSDLPAAFDNRVSRDLGVDIPIVQAALSGYSDRAMRLLGASDVLVGGGDGFR